MFKRHMRERGDSLLKQKTENVPGSSQTRSAHESETFSVGDQTLRERTGRPVIDHDNLSHKSMMVNESDLDFRIPGLSHSVVKHAQSMDKTSEHGALGRHQSCSEERIEVLLNTIERYHSSRNTSCLLYSESC